MFPKTLASRPPAWTNDSQTWHSLDAIRMRVYRAYESQGLRHDSIGAVTRYQLREDVGGSAGILRGPDSSEQHLSGISHDASDFHRLDEQHHLRVHSHGFDNVFVNFTHKLSASTVHSPRTRTSAGICKVGHKHEHRNLL